jgi:tyrosyl-tRNA synthetase
MTDLSTNAQAPSATIDEVFLNQAAFLARHGEYLPGNVEGLARKLEKSVRDNHPLNIKLGLDPTRPDLHLGHSVVLRKLKQFQDLGHKLILIIGDATALIGDPSGRNATRPPLTEAEVQENAQTYLDQASLILDINKVNVVRNSEWLYQINFPKLLELCSRVTVAQLLTRDDFNKRYTGNQPISLHELLYPIMQAYDSVAIQADIELGGTDQRFNLLLGRDVQLAYGFEEPQSVLMMPLLEGTDGKTKMSKTYPEHCINLTDPANSMFGKLMSMPDDMIIRYMSLLTAATDEYIELCKRGLDNGSLHPRELKADVGKCIVADFYGRETANDAEIAFTNQFRHREIPDDIPEAKLTPGSQTLVDIIVTHNLAPSKGEARRLIEGGGVKLDSEKVNDHQESLKGTPGESVVLQVGKRKFLRIHWI